MATFSFSFTYPDDKISDFADFLGYRDTITTQTVNEDGRFTTTSEPNPQTRQEFLQAMATDHINQFTTLYAESRKQADMQAKAQEVAKEYDDGVIAQIKSSLVATID